MPPTHAITLSVIIPALNEERGIGAVLQRLQATARDIPQQFPFVSSVEILVVDDGSTDRTAEVASGVPGVHVLRLERNRGYGGALKAGFSQAQGEWLAFLDADGTYPPEFLPHLVRLMSEENADIVLGSRMAGERSGMPLVRKVGNSFFAALLSWITGQRVTDTASGMRLFRRDVLHVLDPLPDGLNLTPAMTASAMHRQLAIREIPMPYDERVGGSKLRVIQDGLRFLWTILRSMHRYNPMRVFGLLGALLMLVALIYSGELVRQHVMLGQLEDWAIYRLMAVNVALVSGFNLVFFGAVANVVLAATHRIPLFRNGLLAWLLLRPRLLQNSWWFGLLAMGGAAWLTREGLYTYLTMGKVFIHWSYLLVGALLFELGLSMALWGSLVHAVKQLDTTGRRT
jgi:glycosyltransferase involved in cell wall biosynthesis